MRSGKKRDGKNKNRINVTHCAASMVVRNRWHRIITNKKIRTDDTNITAIARHIDKTGPG